MSGESAMSEEQRDELDALAEICIGEGEFEFTECVGGGNTTGVLRSTPALGDAGITVRLVCGEQCKTFVVNHLPPFETRFELPPAYPEVAPIFTVSTEWLLPAQVAALTQFLADDWNAEPGEPVLFRWHSLLQEEYTEAVPALFNSDGDLVFTIDPPPKPTRAPRGEVHATGGPEGGAVMGGTHASAAAAAPVAMAAASAGTSAGRRASAAAAADGADGADGGRGKRNQGRRNGGGRPCKFGHDCRRRDTSTGCKFTHPSDPATPRGSARGKGRGNFRPRKGPQMREASGTPEAYATPMADGGTSVGALDDSATATDTATGAEAPPPPPPPPPPPAAVRICKRLQEYSRAESDRLFDMSHVLCGICFTEKTGKECIQFRKCQHSYCDECVAGYFKSQIEDGNVKQLNCPDTSCRAEALPTEVKKLVDDELYTKYERMLYEITLSEMADVVFCPRTHCQLPVVVEPEQTMGRCEGCQFTFCILCQKAWHGIQPCELERPNKIIEEYLEASPAHRELMKKRFGAARLQKLVNEFHSTSYLKANTARCPQCFASISKIDGCNKMECQMCKTKFCWLCQKKISQSDPYSHFQSGECGGRLFDGIANIHDQDPAEPDEEQWEQWEQVWGFELEGPGMNQVAGNVWN